MSEDQSGIIFGNDNDGYRAPTYDKPSYQENLEAYEAWNRLKAEQSFEVALANIHKNPVASGAEIILELPYHPEFAEVFFDYLVNRLEGCAPVQPEDVDGFLERMYGYGMERPDCDHMLGILGHGRYAVQAPKNIDRAVHWLKSKRSKLPPWPPVLGVDVASERKRLRDNGVIQTSDVIEHRNQEAKATMLHAQEHVFDKLLLPGFSFLLLEKLLSRLKLIDDTGNATATATPAALAGVSIALIKSEHLFGNATAIHRAFAKDFNATISAEALQGKNRLNLKSPKRELYYQMASDYINELTMKA